MCARGCIDIYRYTLEFKCVCVRVWCECVFLTCDYIMLMSSFSGDSDPFVWVLVDCGAVRFHPDLYHGLLWPRLPCFG